MELNKNLLQYLKINEEVNKKINRSS